MAEPPRIRLEHHLKKLKLPTFLREYEKLARQCAADGLDHVQFLARLVEMEMIDRERRLVDRITHHVHILEMNGESYRLKQSRSRRRPPSE